MKLIGENKEFKVYFNCNKQSYSVYKDSNLLIENKYKFSDVKCYLD